MPWVLPYGSRSLPFLVLSSLVFLFLCYVCLSLSFKLFFGQLARVNMYVSIYAGSCGFGHTSPPFTLQLLQPLPRYNLLQDDHGGQI